MLKFYPNLRMNHHVKFALVLFFTLAFWGGTVVAQETRLLSRAEVAGGLPISLNSEELGGGGDLLVFSDSLGHRMALTAATLAGEAIWLQKTSEPVKKEGVIHWYFDEPSRRLVVDIRGIREALSEGAALNLRIAPLSTLSRAFRIAMAPAVSADAAVSEALRPIKTLRVEVNADSGQ